jgi:hypothetical protein
MRSSVWIAEISPPSKTEARIGTDGKTIDFTRHQLTRGSTIKEPTQPEYHRP